MPPKVPKEYSTGGYDEVRGLVDERIKDWSDQILAHRWSAHADKAFRNWWTGRQFNQPYIMTGLAEEDANTINNQLFLHFSQHYRSNVAAQLGLRLENFRHTVLTNIGTTLSRNGFTNFQHLGPRLTQQPRAIVEKFLTELKPQDWWAAMMKQITDSTFVRMPTQDDYDREIHNIWGRSVRKQVREESEEMSQVADPFINVPHHFRRPDRPEPQRPPPKAPAPIVQPPQDDEVMMAAPATPEIRFDTPPRTPSVTFDIYDDDGFLVEEEKRDPIGEAFEEMAQRIEPNHPGQVWHHVGPAFQGLTLPNYLNEDPAPDPELWRFAVHPDLRQELANTYTVYRPPNLEGFTLPLQNPERKLDNFTQLQPVNVMVPRVHFDDTLQVRYLSKLYWQRQISGYMEVNWVEDYIHEWRRLRAMDIRAILRKVTDTNVFIVPTPALPYQGSIRPFESLFNQTEHDFEWNSAVSPAGREEIIVKNPVEMRSYQQYKQIVASLPIADRTEEQRTRMREPFLFWITTAADPQWADKIFQLKNPPYFIAQILLADLFEWNLDSLDKSELLYVAELLTMWPIMRYVMYVFDQIDIYYPAAYVQLSFQFKYSDYVADIEGNWRTITETMVRGDGDLTLRQHFRLMLINMLSRLTKELHDYDAKVTESTQIYMNRMDLRFMKELSFDPERVFSLYTNNDLASISKHAPIVDVGLCAAETLFHLEHETIQVRSERIKLAFIEWWHSQSPRVRKQLSEGKIDPVRSCLSDRGQRLQVMDLDSGDLYVDTLKMSNVYSWDSHRLCTGDSFKTGLMEYFDKDTPLFIRSNNHIVIFNKFGHWAALLKLVQSYNIDRQRRSCPPIWQKRVFNPCLIEHSSSTSRITEVFYDIETCNDPLTGNMEPFIVCFEWVKGSSQIGSEVVHSQHFTRTPQETVLIFMDRVRDWIYEMFVNTHYKSQRAKKGLTRSTEVRLWAHNGCKFDAKYLFADPLWLKISDFAGSPTTFKYAKLSNLTFADSYNFFSTSLNKLAESFLNERKSEHDDFRAITTGNYSRFVDTMLPYCQTDVSLLRRIMWKFFELTRALRVPAAGLGCYVIDHEDYLTASGFGIGFFKSCFLTKNLHAPPTAIYDLLRPHYYGGFTQVFIPKPNPNISQELFYYDVNSMYPYCMTKNMPCQVFGKQSHTKGVHMLDQPLEFNEFERLVPNIYGHIRTYLMTWKVADQVSICHLGVRSKGGIYYVRENLDSPQWRWDVEVKPFVERFDQIMIHGYIEWTHEPLFATYINHLYDARLKAKAEGNKPLDMLLKLLMNSTYGRCGQKPNKIKFWGELLRLHHIIKSRNLSKDVTAITPISDGFFEATTRFLSATSTDGGFINIASYITASARAELMRRIAMVGDHNVVYCDTDSVITYIQLPKDEIDDKMLGRMKLEHRLRTIDAVFPAAKVYCAYSITENKWIRHAKGVREEEFDKIFDDDRETALSKDISNQQFKYHNGSIYLTSQKKMIKFYAPLRRIYDREYDSSDMYRNLAEAERVHQLFKTSKEHEKAQFISRLGPKFWAETYPVTSESILEEETDYMKQVSIAREDAISWANNANIPLSLLGL